MIDRFIFSNNDIEHYFKNGSEPSPVFSIPQFEKEFGHGIDEFIEMAKIKNDASDVDLSDVSIAVIGNSGLVLDSEKGDEIDKHDIVIRCNLGKVVGYEKHVGSKTTFRIVSGKSSLYANEHTDTFSDWDINFLSSLQNEHIIFSSYRVNHYIKGFGVHRKARWLHYLNQNFIKECQELVNDYPSIGFQAIILATQLSNNVSIYGFNFFEEDWKTQHYFEEIKPYDRGHSFSNEKEYVNMLKNRRLVNG